MSKTVKRWIVLLALAVLMAGAWFSGLVESLGLDAIQDRRAEIQEFVQAHPILSAVGFTLFYAGSVALSLPIAAVLTLLGGFLFGRWIGTVLVVSAATMGACAIFLIARSTAGEALRRKAGPLYQRISEQMDRNAVNYLLFLRLVPLFPFFLVNIVPALFNMRLRTYALTTFFGILPGTFVYVNLGRELGSIHSLADLGSPQTLAAFCLLGFFALLPAFYRKRRIED